MKLRNVLIILLLVVVAGFASSCRKKKIYLLTGKLPISCDGCKVFISPATFYFLPEKSMPIDSTIVHDGKFRFTGTIDENPTVFVVTINDLEERGLARGNSYPVIVEEGDITMVYDSLGVVITGTSLNERYSELIGKGQRELRHKQLQLLRQRDSLNAKKTLSPNELNKWYSESYRDAFQKYEIKSAEKFIEENAGTIVGDYFFFQYALNQYDKTFLDMIYSKINQNLLKCYELMMKERKEKEDYLYSAQKETSVGNPFREIISYTLDGKEVRLSELVKKHKLVCVEFWGSWCVPCIQKIPSLKKLYKTYEQKGLEILGVSLDCDREKWKSSLEKHQPAGIQVCDFKGWDSPARQDYGFSAIPRIVLIDSMGKIISWNSHDLEKVVEKYFEK